MRIETHVCDLCKKPKGEGNHWFKGYLLDADDTNKTVGAMVVQHNVSYVSVPFRRQQLPDPDVDLCGEECAVKWMHRALAKEATL